MAYLKKIACSRPHQVFSLNTLKYKVKAFTLYFKVLSIYYKHIVV